MTEVTGTDTQPTHTTSVKVTLRFFDSVVHSRLSGVVQSEVKDRGCMQSESSTTENCFNNSRGKINRLSSTWCWNIC